MSGLQKLQFLCPKPQTLSLQIVRYRMGVYKHKKPRWHGPAPSKQFVLPPIDNTPPDDIEQLLKLSWQHRDRVAAISQLLYEEGLRHSSAGEAAKEERKIADDQDEQLLQENEEINVQIAKTRELRLQKDAIIEEETIRHELKKYDKEKAIKNREMEDFIKEETKALENRIKLEDLERAIEIALDSPIDYEYAIDTEGHIYRGRETKSILVKRDDREKIPRPVKEGERLLQDSRYND